jgi:hypothetical protein
MERVIQDERYLPEFTLRYCDKLRRWLIQRRFDQIQFHPAIKKRWFRSAEEVEREFSRQRANNNDDDDRGAGGIAPHEGLVMCMLNPDSTTLVDHGDCFEFTLAVSVIRFSELLRNQESSTTTIDSEAAGVAWWSSALTPSREGARSIPNPGNPFPTLGIGASPLFWDLAGRFCSILNMAQLVPKNRTPCKSWWRDSQNPIHKKRQKID